MLENYTLHETLGQGSFGKVFRVTENKTGFEFALKRIEVKKG